eukprot:CAMPEP_0206153676 /NCGR_PEP_ID=MMETSP1474-20131121/816_1 /ASSEMBLY_ACC=CAM_ASM_001110 /TAXON_ID=97495 /ORGANISM="Imantonia sp., Strain RCC918" /LENGTH=45 /DNA_ID= /DNA_START= /DNA_END= /DNA_ORIENTATION=
MTVALRTASDDRFGHFCSTFAPEAAAHSAHSARRERSNLILKTSR